MADEKREHIPGVFYGGGPIEPMAGPEVSPDWRQRTQQAAFEQIVAVHYRATEGRLWVRAAIVALAATAAAGDDPFAPQNRASLVIVLLALAAGTIEVLACVRASRELRVQANLSLPRFLTIGLHREWPFGEPYGLRLQLAIGDLLRILRYEIVLAPVALGGEARQAEQKTYGHGAGYGVGVGSEGKAKSDDPRPPRPDRK